MINEQQHAPATKTQSPAELAAIESDVRQVIAALRVMLSGASGEDGDLGHVADVTTIAGAPLTTSGLFWIGDVARMNGQHVLHVSKDRGSNIPNIALAFLEGDHLTIVQNCYLAIEKRGSRMMVIPDSFKDGAFRLGRGGCLERCRAPKSFTAALPALKRAYDRFHELRANLDAGSVAPIHFKLR